MSDPRESPYQWKGAPMPEAFFDSDEQCIACRHWQNHTADCPLMAMFECIDRLRDGYAATERAAVNGGTEWVWIKPEAGVPNGWYEAPMTPAQGAVMTRHRHKGTR